MVGYFRFVKDNKVVFYEIVTIVETNGTLAMRLKHFHADLKGWEEKDDMQEFKLVAVEGQTAYFDGLSMRRDGDTLYSAVQDQEQERRQHARRAVQLQTEEVTHFAWIQPLRLPSNVSENSLFCRSQSPNLLLTTDASKRSYLIASLNTFLKRCFAMSAAGASN